MIPAASSTLLGCWTGQPGNSQLVQSLHAEAAQYIKHQNCGKYKQSCRIARLKAHDEAQTNLGGKQQLCRKAQRAYIWHAAWAVTCMYIFLVPLDACVSSFACVLWPRSGHRSGHTLAPAPARQDVGPTNCNSCCARHTDSKLIPLTAQATQFVMSVGLLFSFVARVSFHTWPPAAQ